MNEWWYSLLTRRSASMSQIINFKAAIFFHKTFSWDSGSVWNTIDIVFPKFYPTLGCDIQVFLAMGSSVQYWPRWFQDFPAIWLAVSFGANGAHLGICTLPEKSRLCVWNMLFLGEINFPKRRTCLAKSLWWQIVPVQESTNEWKKSNNFENNGTCGNTMGKPPTVRYRLMK